MVVTFVGGPHGPVACGSVKQDLLVTGMERVLSASMRCVSPSLTSYSPAHCCFPGLGLRFYLAVPMKKVLISLRIIVGVHIGNDNTWVKVGEKLEHAGVGSRAWTAIRENLSAGFASEDD